MGADVLGCECTRVWVNVDFFRVWWYCVGGELRSVREGWAWGKVEKCRNVGCVYLNCSYKQNAESATNATCLTRVSGYIM